MMVAVGLRPVLLAGHWVDHVIEDGPFARVTASLAALEASARASAAANPQTPSRSL